MRELHHHLLRLLLAGMLLLGTAGLRTLHVAGCHAAEGQEVGARHVCSHSHTHIHSQTSDSRSGGVPVPAPQDSDDCHTCQQVEGIVGGLPELVGPPVFHALVCVQDADAPRVSPAPVAPRAVCARPPPTC